MLGVIFELLLVRAEADGLDSLKRYRAFDGGIDFEHDEAHSCSTGADRKAEVQARCQKSREPVLQILVALHVNGSKSVPTSS